VKRQWVRPWGRGAGSPECPNIYPLTGLRAYVAACAAVDDYLMVTAARLTAVAATAAAVVASEDTSAHGGSAGGGGSGGKAASRASKRSKADPQPAAAPESGDGVDGDAAVDSAIARLQALMRLKNAVGGAGGEEAAPTAAPVAAVQPASQDPAAAFNLTAAQYAEAVAAVLPSNTAHEAGRAKVRSMVSKAVGDALLGAGGVTFVSSEAIERAGVGVEAMLSAVHPIPAAKESYTAALRALLVSVVVATGEGGGGGGMIVSVCRCARGCLWRAITAAITAVGPCVCRRTLRHPPTVAGCTAWRAATCGR